MRADFKHIHVKMSVSENILVTEWGIILRTVEEVRGISRSAVPHTKARSEAIHDYEQRRSRVLRISLD